MKNLEEITKNFYGCISHIIKSTSIDKQHQKPVKLSLETNEGYICMLGCTNK